MTSRYLVLQLALLSGLLGACTTFNSAPAVDVPAGLRSPALSADAGSLSLVWQKPAQYQDIVDYEVWMDGKPLGSALENLRQHSPAQAYVDQFYAEDKDQFHVRVQPHNFRVTGLTANSEHRFAVRARHADGHFSVPSSEIPLRTTSLSTICDASKNGAIADGATLNTVAIQSTIDNCPAGGTVRLSGGVFKSGALFLKSNLTFEVAEGATLLGSERAEDYPLARGYILYEYTTSRRPPSLLNALDQQHRELGAFENIRITGRGKIDGNGFVRLPEAQISSEIGAILPQYVQSDRNKVGKDGILAKSQVEKAVAEGMPVAVAYGQRRSSLMTFRGVKNLYIENITVVNPAFHGIMVLESENATVANVTHTSFDVNNGDGIEFGNSQHVMVFNNFIDTGDDCVNFAAGTGADAAKQPAQRDAWIFNNYMRRGHGAVVLGSHTGAWIEDVLAEDNVINKTWIGLRGKSNNLNGGGGRRITYRDNAHRDLEREAFIFTLEYSDANALIDYKPALVPGKFEDIRVQHNTVEFSPAWKQRPVSVGGKMMLVDFRAIEIVGDPKSNAYHERITFDDVTIKGSFPAKVDGLRNSTFRDVRFINVKGDKPWAVKNAEGLRFEGATAQP